MTTKTITVKRIYRKEGTTTKGKKYTLTKLLGTDSQYYTTFEPILNAIKEGADVTLDIKNTEKSDTFNIIKVISANPTSRSHEEDGPDSNSLPFGDQTLPTNAADAYARDLLARAIEMAHEKMPEWERMSEYPFLIAELVHVMHANIAGQQIALNDAKKLKAYGKG